MAERIPEEVVAHILSFLNLSDRKSAALVCLKWYHASRYPNLLRDTVAAVLFSRGNTTSVPAHWYKTLVNVSFRGMDIGSSDFVAFLSGCPMLQSLDLSCCDNLLLCGDNHFMAQPLDVERLQSTLTRLQSINLSSLRHLTDATFNKLMAIGVNLASINLTGCPISFMTTEYSVMRSNCVLTFDNIMNYVRSHSQQLHTLHFSETHISDQALLELGGTTGLRLSGIFLDRCDDITPKGLIPFAKAQPDLEVFSLAWNNNLFSECASALVSAWPRLKILDFAKNGLLGPNFLTAFARSPRNLVSLNLNSNALTESTLTAALGSPHLARLRVLRLGHCSGVTDEVVAAMCGVLTELRVLELCSAFKITDQAVVSICANLRNLQVLDLRWCRTITDAGFIAAAPNGDKHTATAASASHGLAHLARLRDLDLSQTEVGDPLLIAAPPLLNLQRLHLDGNRRVTDKGLEALAAKATSLEELNISMATITDEGMMKMLPRLVRLRNLHVASCEQLSDAILPVMTRHCPNLRELNVSFCGGITGNGLDQLERRAASLRHLKRRLIDF